MEPWDARRPLPALSAQLGPPLLLVEENQKGKRLRKSNMSIWLFSHVLCFLMGKSNTTGEKMLQSQTAFGFGQECYFSGALREIMIIQSLSAPCACGLVFVILIGQLSSCWTLQAQCF